MSAPESPRGALPLDEAAIIAEAARVAGVTERGIARWPEVRWLATQVHALRAEADRLRASAEEIARRHDVTCEDLRLMRKERDALAAHVEALTRALERRVAEYERDDASFCERKGIGPLPHDSARVEDMKELLALARTPAQSLSALRASVRSEAFAEAAAAIRSNVASLWPSGVSFVQDAKSHGAENAAMWIEPLAQKGANDAEA